jgi:hypothetical protein
VTRTSARAGRIDSTVSATAHQKVWPKALARGAAISARPAPETEAIESRLPLAPGMASAIGRADRSAHALDDVQGAGGARDGGAVERRVGGRHRRHHRRAERDAADEEDDADQPERRVAVQQRERDGGHRHQRDPERGHAPAADAVGERAGDRHGQRRAQPLRGLQQPGVERALAAGDLEEQRQQQHRAEEGGGDQEGGHRRRGEGALGEQPHVDQWPRGPQRVQDEGADQQHPGEQRQPGGDGAQAAVRRGLGEAEDEQAEAGGEQRQAEQVEAAGVLGGLGARQPAQPHEDADDADRHVDVEDPAPRQVVDDQAADHRSEHRSHEHGHADDAHHAADALGAGRLGQQDHADRHDHAAADALHDAEGDQRGQVPGQAAEDRAGDEEDDRGQPHAAGAEALGGPAGERDDHGQGEQVAGGHPLHVIERGVEVDAQRLQGDVDDRGVEDRHDRADHDDGRDDGEVAIDPQVGGALTHDGKG